MSILLQLRKQIDAASARVLSLERAVRDYPDLPSVAANLDSAVRIKANLEEQFADSAEQLGYDICSYRAFDERNKPMAAAALGVISQFQTLVSVVYGAIKYGEKQRATVPERVANETSFDLGYAFTGSVGIVLTIRREKLLFGSTALDETFDAISSMAKATSSDEITSFAAKLGPGPINALYKWVDGQVAAGLGSDIEWKKGSDAERSLFIQRQELLNLRSTIEETGSEEVTTETVVGSLRMADVDNLRFKLKCDGQPPIKGTLEQGVVDDEHIANLPKKYSVLLRKTIQFQFAKDKEVTRYHILKLSELPKSKKEK